MEQTSDGTEGVCGGGGGAGGWWSCNKRSVGGNGANFSRALRGWGGGGSCNKRSVGGNGANFSRALRGWGGGWRGHAIREVWEVMEQTSHTPMLNRSISKHHTEAKHFTLAPE